MADYTTKVHLPSYKADVYKDNPEFREPVILRMVTAADELEAAGSHTDALDKLIRRCVKSDKSFDSHKLFPEDRMFLLVALRCHSYGTDYHGEFTCPDCGYSGEVQFDIQQDVDVFELPEDYREPFEIKLPVSKMVIQMRKLTTADMNAATSLAKSLAKTLRKNQRAVERLELMKRRIVGIDGEPTDPVTAEAAILSLVGKDRAYMDTKYEMYKLGYDNEADCLCPQCGAEGRVPFNMTGEFLHPRFD